MKKLMIALSAAATAFGLFAADSGFIAGTSFEADTAGAIQAADIDGGGWSTTDAAATLTVATEGVASGVSRPVHFAKDGNTKYLNVKTAFGKPLTKTLTSAQEIGDGVYFDSLVNLTPCDTTPTLSGEAAKLAVWIETNEAETQTNLYVCAGQFVSGVAGTNVYNCGTAPAEGWHRLTIKAIGTIYKDTSGPSAVPGFVVYIDGGAVSTTTGTGVAVANLTPNAKGFNELGRLFPSLDQRTVDKNGILSVSFEGQGSIDDVVFTTAAPDFAKDNEYFTIVKGENVTQFGYIVGEAAEGTATGDLQLGYSAGMTVTITNVVCAEGYMYDGISGDTGVTTTGNTFAPSAKNQSGTVNAKVAVAEFNGKMYDSVAAALGDANTITAAGTYTLKLWGNTSAGGVSFGNGTVGVKLVLDLAGKTITAGAEDAAAIELTAGDLLITNSTVAVGTVNGGDGYAVAATGGSLVIAAGIYESELSLDNADSAAITGGKFKVKPDASFAPTGYEFVEKSGYYELAVAKIALSTIELSAYTVAYGTTTPPTATVKAGETTVDSANYDLTYDPALTASTAAGTKITVTATAKGDTYKGSASTTFTVVAASVTPEITLSATEAEWTSEVTFPMVTVTGYTEGTDYDKVWDPAAISEPSGAGVTNTYTVTVTMKGNYTGSNTATFKVGKPAASVPSWISEAGAETIAKYNTWAKDNGVSDPAAAKQDAFLLNCANNDEAIADAKANFKITSITIVDGEPVIEGPDASKYNGTVERRGSTTVDGTYTSDCVDPKFFKYYLYLPTAN